MNKSLLRKTAIQSVVLMLVVLTSSFALKQYQTVTIEAVSRYSEAEAAVNTTDPQAVSVLETEPEGAEQPKVQLTKVQKSFSGADPNVLGKLGENYLVIKKPEGSQLKLSLEDIYINKSIQLTITGMSDDKLNSDMITRVRDEQVFSGDPNYTEKTSRETDENGNENEVIVKDYNNDLSHGITVMTNRDEGAVDYTACLMIELDNVYVYTVYEDAIYYYINLQKPADVYDKILVIDAGHGGKDGGASSRDGRYLEKNLNLEIVLELKKLLDNENIKVYYTRTKDDSVYLRPRVELANSVDSDYFVSIHCNSNRLSYPNGSEVLYYNEEFKGVKTLELAKLFSTEFGDSVALENKGTVAMHKNDIYIMRKSKVPMILIEVGYLSNTSDMNYMVNSDNRKAIAKGIFNGIMKAYDKLPVDR
jgi:N-acetylmuramoyl-L-alanine amidase